jgi:hypothetical protein
MCDVAVVSADDGVTSLVDGRLQRIDRLCRLDRHAAGCEIDLDLRCGVLLADRVGYGRHAMLAAHAFYLKFDRHLLCLEKHECCDG